MEYQFPLSPFTGVYADVTNPDNEQNIVSDRRLVADLRTNELYRRAIGLGGDPSAVPGRSALSAFRARLGPEGFWALHRHFVLTAHARGLTEPALAQLPANRRPGVIAIVDGTFLRAYCHQHPKKGEDGERRFADPSVAEWIQTVRGVGFRLNPEL